METYQWGEEPDSLVKDAVAEIDSGTALVLGAGYGRNAAYLADNGFDVTAVEQDPREVEKLEEYAGNIRKQIDVRETGITEFEYEEEYDLVLALNVLHFLEEPREEVRRMQDHTKPGGVNVVAAFLEENGGPFPYLFEEEELKAWYQDRDWDIQHYDEYETPPEQHGDGPVHTHHVAELQAVKP